MLSFILHFEVSLWSSVGHAVWQAAYGVGSAIASLF